MNHDSKIQAHIERMRDYYIALANGEVSEEPIDYVGVGSMLRARIEVPTTEFHKIEFSGTTYAPQWHRLNHLHISRLGGHTRSLVIQRPNAFVDLGLHFILDRIFNINTPNTAITHMGISDDETAVVAGTTELDPSPSGDSPAIRTLGSGVGASATSRTGNIVSSSAGWADTDFTTPFPVTKVGLLNTSTDAADDTVPTVQGIMNIIGGTDGTAPYDEPFTIDLTNVSAFNLTLQIDTEAQAT